MEGRQVISSHWSPESSFKVPSLLGTTPGDLPLVPRRQKLYSLLPSDRELSVEVSDFLSGQGGGAKSPPVAGSSMLIMGYTGLNTVPPKLTSTWNLRKETY